MTQGLVTVQKNGKVVMKIVAGNDGQQAKVVAKAIRKRWPVDIDAAYRLALSKGFGSVQSLVVITGSHHRYDGDDKLGPLYRRTFNQPKFNPRWAAGIADCTEIVDV